MRTDRGTASLDELIVDQDDHGSHAQSPMKPCQKDFVALPWHVRPPERRHARRKCPLDLLQRIGVYH